MMLARAVTAEFVGTAFLLAIVVGSGIMGEKLAMGNAAVALLANSISTGTGLYALIIMFGPISGGHFNPVVSCVSLYEKILTARACAAYILAQCTGALLGVAAAHAMFGLPILQVSAHMRPTAGEGLGEVIATLGLVTVILFTSRFRRDAVPIAVACFITSAYWFTSSTSFSNPAVTLARAATDTFAGISPTSVPMFVGGQLLGGLAAVVLARWLLGRTRT